MRIIVDAMGGDNAPQAIVKGALQAQKELGAEIVLVGREAHLRKCGRLADISPTILDLMDLQQPKEMTGESLILQE